MQQEPQLDETLDVRGNVDLALAPIKNLLARYEVLSAKLGESLPEKEYDKVMEEFSTVQEAIEHGGGWEVDREVDIAMDALRLPPGDAKVSTLSGGERRRVALCRLLLEKPDMLLLDEPTNHLDAESVAWLEQHLQQFPGTVIAVTHDRYFLDNVAGWILELDRGEGIPFKGNYTSWLEQKRARLEHEEKSESARRRTLARELEWVRLAPRARQAKNKARLQAYDAMASEAEREKATTGEVQIPPGPRLGDLVVEARGLKKAYGDRVLFDDLSFSLPRGGIVGVIGANGTGKSTLFRLIAGQQQPDAGTLRVGDTVVLAYVDQMRDALDGDKTVWQEVSEGKDSIEVGKRTIPSRAYVGEASAFAGATSRSAWVTSRAASATGSTSPSSSSAAATCCCSTSPPTTSTSTRCAPSKTRSSISPGCVMVTSHDRWFLDRIATHMLAFEGRLADVVWFEGNYQDYEADRVKRLGAEAAQPHRTRFKKITG